MMSRVFVAWLLGVRAAVAAPDPPGPEADGRSSSVFVGPELKIYDQLQAGDSVTVRLTESVVVALRPNAKTTVIEDRTAAANNEARGAGNDVIQQLKATVTVERVDAATGM